MFITDQRHTTISGQQQATSDPAHTDVEETGDVDSSAGKR